MKNFLVFGYDQYYPCGGWHDLIGSFETLQEAEAQAKKSLQHFATIDIVDLEKGTIIQ